MSFQLVVGVLLTSCTASDVCSAGECIPMQNPSMLQAQRKLSQHAYQGLLSWRDAWDADPHMFENCSKVFIDVGSNAGTHIRKLYEPEKYPEAKYSSVLDAAFGPVWFRGQMSSKTGICAFGFEANPRWQSRYHEIETAYAKKGWRAKWFAPMAVSNETGEATFWLNDDGANADWGASLVNRGTESSVTVPEVDFANFIETLSKQALPGYKLMKMDI